MNHFVITIAGIDISNAVDTVSVTNKLSDRPVANISLRMSRLATSVVDLCGYVQIVDMEQSSVFAGEITRATVDQNFAHLVAMSGLALSDTSVSPTMAFGLENMEHIRTLLRHAGLTPSEFDLDGLSVPNPEYFECIFPVTGITVRDRSFYANSTFLSVAVLQNHPWVRAAATEQVVKNFMEADSFVLVGRPAVWCTDAEDESFPVATEAVAHVTVASRNKNLFDLNSHVYRRSDSKVIPRVKPSSLIRGSVTGRGWIRDMNVTSALAAVPLPNFESSTTSLQSAPDDLRQSVLSLYRAISSSLPLSQNLAFWDAVEFYSSGVSDSTKIFSKSDHRQLLRQVINAGGWSQIQRDRLLEAKKMLNAQPLLKRFRRRLVSDGIPFTELEFAAVSRLRSERNAAVHGKAIGSGESREDFRVATSVLARALTAALASCL